MIKIFDESFFRIGELRLGVSDSPKCGVLNQKTNVQNLCCEYVHRPSSKSFTVEK